MEQIAKMITMYIVYAAEIIAAIIIGLSVLQILGSHFLSLLTKAAQESIEHYRMRFGSSVALSLEILLGADVLATAISPSWNDIGQLAAIATMRTLLNYFLAKELKHSAK